jgi:hypothetical protein
MVKMCQTGIQVFSISFFKKKPIYRVLMQSGHKLEY